MIKQTTHPLQKRYAVSPAQFRRQMQLLKLLGYSPISLGDIHEYILHDKKLPERPISVTFDDGYMDNYISAFPILNAYGIPGTVFIVSGRIGASNKWDVLNGRPEEDLMGWDELLATVKTSITLGSHTVSHPRLPQLEPNEAKKEIEESKKILEDRLGIPIHHFCYPHGKLNERLVDMVRQAGYRTGCSVKPGFNVKSTDRYALKRIGVFGDDSLMQFALKIAFGTNDGRPIRILNGLLERITDNIAGHVT
jgi:peptidoglycan/xylan/chitin deacetylase (PgdA/CDA1 family)